MPNKRVIVAVIGAALLFGAVMSGCNRNRDSRSVASTRRPVKDTKRQNRDLAQAPNVRPAEVLAASVRRPRRPSARPMDARPQTYQDYRQTPVQPMYSQPGYELAQKYEPLPEPVPVSELYRQSGVYSAPAYEYQQPTYQAAQTYVPSYAVHAPSAPAYEPVQVIHPSPELAMARATLTPLPEPASAYVPQVQPTSFVPPINPQMFQAPIPELEPVRYQRVAQQQAPAPLMSGPVQQRQGGGGFPVSRDVRRALEPLAQPSASTQGWVPSPATAMGGGRGFY